MDRVKILGIAVYNARNYVDIFIGMYGIETIQTNCRRHCSMRRADVLED